MAILMDASGSLIAVGGGGHALSGAGGVDGVDGESPVDEIPWRTFRGP